MSLEESIKELAQSIRDLTVALNKPITAPEAGNVLQKLSDEFAKLPGGVAVISSDGKVIEPPGSAAEETAPAPKPKKAKAPKVEEPAPTPEPVKAEEPAPAPAPAKEYTLADLREAAQRALDNGKLNQVVDLNKAYGVKRISEVPAHLYGEIIAKLEALTNGQA